MRVLSRRDVVSALITGLTTGFIAWRILVFLDKSLPLGVPSVTLIWLAPIIWLVGVQFGYFLGSFIKPFIRFGRFTVIGFTNAAVDFGVLYLFIGLTGLASGIAYSVFKTISFTAGVTHSYFWNKYWSFEAGSSGGGSSEVLRFLVVALISIGINVAAASIAVALRPETVDPKVWAGVSAIIGSAVALIFSFAGFQLFVFNKK